MLGGHMDSWHSGTGATDNAAGVCGGHGSRSHYSDSGSETAPHYSHRSCGVVKNKDCWGHGLCRPALRQDGTQTTSAAEAGR